MADVGIEWDLSSITTLPCDEYWRIGVRKCASGVHSKSQVRVKVFPMIPTSGELCGNGPSARFFAVVAPLKSSTSKV